MTRSTSRPDPPTSFDSAAAEATPVPRKQREIRRTAARLFERYGVRRVSVEEICREAGCSKGTFYKYFSNKNELVKHILTVMSEAVHRRTDRIDALDVSFAEKVRLFTNERLEATQRSSATFIEDLIHADEGLQEFVAELTADNHRRFLEFITAAQARGEVRADIKPAFMLAVLAKMSELAADEELKGHYGDYVEITREIVDFFFHGVVA